MNQNIFNPNHLSNKNLYGFLFLFVALISENLFSQEVKVIEDFGLWGAVCVERKFHDDFTVNLEQQIRFYHNASRIDDYIADLGLDYDINNRFKIGANFRFTHDWKRDRSAETDLRYNLDFGYRTRKLGRFRIDYRLRYQKEYEDLFINEPDQNYYTIAMRNRLRIKYFSNETHQLFTSAELFRSMEVFRESYFNQFRFFLGDKIKIRHGDFEVSLGYEREIQTDHPLSFLFTSIRYTIQLKP